MKKIGLFWADIIDCAQQNTKYLFIYTGNVSLFIEMTSYLGNSKPYTLTHKQRRLLLIPLIGGSDRNSAHSFGNSRGVFKGRKKRAYEMDVLEFTGSGMPFFGSRRKSSGTSGWTGVGLSGNSRN